MNMLYLVISWYHNYSFLQFHRFRYCPSHLEVSIYQLQIYTPSSALLYKTEKLSHVYRDNSYIQLYYHLFISHSCPLIHGFCHTFEGYVHCTQTSKNHKTPQQIELGNNCCISSHWTKNKSTYRSIHTGVLEACATSAAELIKITFAPNSFFKKRIHQIINNLLFIKAITLLDFIHLCIRQHTIPKALQEMP